MADVKFLAPVVDGVLLVVGVGKSSTGMVRRCLRELEQIGAGVAGIVLNGIRKTPGGYLQRNLKQFYAYGANGTNGSAGDHLPEMVVVDDEADAEAESERAMALIDDYEDAPVRRPRGRG